MLQLIWALVCNGIGIPLVSIVIGASLVYGFWSGWCNSLFGHADTCHDAALSATALVMFAALILSIVSIDRIFGPNRGWNIGTYCSLAFLAVILRALCYCIGIFMESPL